MSYGVRTDQQQRVIDFLAEHMHGEEIGTIAVDRSAGKGSWRQVGDTWSADELEALGEPEALLDAILDSKARGTGKWRIRAYYSASVQPEIRMETVSDAPTQRAAPDSGGAALRDLASTLQRGADNNAARLDSAMDKISSGTDKLVEILTAQHVRERTLTDEAAATNTTLAVAVAQRDAQIEILRMEVERLSREDRSAGILGLLTQLPPEVSGQLIMGAVGLAGSLSSAVVEYVQARTRSIVPALPAPAPAPEQAKASEQPEGLAEAIKRAEAAEARAEALAVKLAEDQAPKVKRASRAKPKA